MTKYYINDEEFSNLNWYDQRNYRWCKECKIYYHVDSNHVCNNYKPNNDDKNLVISLIQNPKSKTRELIDVTP